MFFIVQLSLISSFLFVNVFADNEAVLYYNATIGILVALSDPAVILTKSVIYVKPYQKIKDSVITGLMMHEITVLYGKNQKIDYSECKSFQDYRDSILQPFVLTNNPDGTFKHILVNKDEHLTSSNLKLHYATLLQNKFVKPIQENKYLNFKTKENLFYGTCNTIYDVVNVFIPSNSAYIQVRKDYDMNSCSGLNDTEVKNKYDYCTSEPEEDLNWILKSKLSIQQNNAVSVFNQVSATETFTFKPFKDDPKKLVMLSVISWSKIDAPPFNRPIPDFDENNAKMVTANYLVPVNETLLNDTNIKNKQLRDIYKALSCYKNGQSIYLDYFASFLQCTS